LPTNMVTITMNPTIVVGSISANQAICSGSIPTLLNGVAPSNGTAPTYQWQSSLNGSSFNNISGATMLNYQPGALTVTTYYRQMQDASGTCGGPLPTNMVTITMNPTIVVGSISADQAICIGAIPALLNGVAPSNGTAPTYQWQSSLSSSGFANISGATMLNYQPGALTVTTYYRQMQDASGTCGGPLPTNFVIITVNPLPVPTITGPASVCLNSTGNVYTTQTGMTGYTWTVTGGAITAGALTNSITVIWNTVGVGTVCVNYTNANGCTPTTPVCYNVTVNPLPVPTITGPASVCLSSTGNVYTTQTGMTGYTWTVTGGAITAGAGTNSVTVTWNTVGAATVCVNYTNANGCTATTPVCYNVTVNPLPVPTITGPATACLNSTGNVYTTQAGMTGYTWAVTGGAIAAGVGTNAITVTWNSTGVKTVCVNYTNANGCTALAPVCYNVTVNPLPVPTITGAASACVNSTGNVYTTEAGMTGYTWAVSGGTPTGVTTNTITVTWNTVGVQTITVNYTNANGCSASTPTSKTVTVNPLPVPTITGPSSVCVGTTSNVYTTEAGMTGYTWSVAAGGNITSGGASNAITVTWTTAGAKTVCVNYTNTSGCTAAAPTCYNVTVNAIPTPTITGPATVCQGATATYTTQPGMTNYIWTFSGGGTLVSGGTPTSNTITISWNIVGNQAVTVNYTSGCPGSAPVTYNVTVNPTPVPTIGSTNNPCIGSTNNVYYTESGMTGYIWTVSNGTFTGQGTSILTVTWTQPGIQTVTVNYTNASGCSAPQPTVYTVFVNSPPNAANPITGTATVCAGTNGVVYSTTPIVGATSYNWVVTGGGTFTGQGTTSITVNFPANATSGAVIVSGMNQCGPGPSSSFAVTVNPLPAAAGTITGPTSVCAGSSGVTYTVPAIANATSYTWTVTGGATFTGTTNTIVVNFSVNPGTVVITVKGVNSCGSGVVSPSFTVTVNPIPAAPVVTAAGAVLTSSATTGNQWYYEGTGLLPGAVNQTYTATITGWYWCVVTVNGCTSDTSNHVYVLFVGQDELPGSSFNVYPVPNNGNFRVAITTPSEETFTIRVYNQLGVMVYEMNDARTIGGKFNSQVNLNDVADGLYSVVFLNEQHKVIRKMIVSKLVRE
ncbi:MAG: T9SS type A sorting domain-containing protein, partial [Bacteroidota bacterium]